MHYPQDIPGGAECSCGKRFYYSPKYGMDSVRFANMARGNARRHAEAANRKEAAEQEGRS